MNQPMIPTRAPGAPRLPFPYRPEAEVVAAALATLQLSLIHI